MSRIPALLVVVSALSAVTAIPAVAAAPSKPGVSAQGASQVTATSARLNAKVNPAGQSTTYSFQYGPSVKYGATTPVAPAGAGTKAIAAHADIVGLKANTTYHYRVVASNPTGVNSGADRTFKTAKVPLSLSVAAVPNPVPFGAPTMLNGALAGTGGGGRAIQVQQNAFPYTSGFANTGNPVLTAADGTFSIPVVGLAANSQFRVTTVDGAKLTSPAIIIGVSPIVRTAVSTTRPRRNRLVRFAGTVTPQWVPAQVAVQKKSSTGRWVTVAGTITRGFGPEKAKYAKRVRVHRGGTYRIFVGLTDSRYAPAIGREFKLRVR